MLASSSLRRLPCRPRTTCLRNLSTTPVARNAQDKENRAFGMTGRNSAEMLDIFLRDTGARFRDPIKPNNWLGGDRPFPLNHSFKPPVPVSDALRTQIYAKFMSDPVTHSVRALAAAHGLSLKRVDAILRLKGLEAHLNQENKPLQTGFQAGMEWCLGVTQHAEHSAFQRVPETAQTDVREADALMEAEGNDPARLRYRKMFWEPVADGKDPVVPLLLERARADGIRHAHQEEQSKNHSRFLTPQPGTSKEKVRMVAPPGRPMMKFSDVGGKFIDKDESLKRIKKLAHRSSLKARRRAVKGGEKDEAIREAAAEAREKVRAGKLAKKVASGEWKAAMEEKARAGSAAARNLVLE